MMNTGFKVKEIVSLQVVAILSSRYPSFTTNDGIRHIEYLGRVYAFVMDFENNTARCCGSTNVENIRKHANEPLKTFFA